MKTLRNLWYGLKQYGFFENIPSDLDPTPELLPQRGTFWIGLVLTLGLLGFTVWNLFFFIAAAITGMVLFVVSLYGLAVAAFFWGARLYANGLSFKKFFFGLFAPVVFVFTAIFGSATLREQLAGMQSKRPADAKGSTRVAVVAGVLFSLAMVAMLVQSIHIALGLLPKMEMLAVNLFLVGMAVQFWGSRAYKEGLSLLEAVKAVLWFLGAYGMLRPAKPVPASADSGVPVNSTD